MMLKSYRADAWTVRFAPDFDAEFSRLAAPVQVELLAQAKLVERFGPALGRPRIDTLKGSRHSNMKELRFDAGGGVWRVAFAFDRRRQAILLVAGDKSGVGSGRFYRRLIAAADARFDAHLARDRTGTWEKDIMGRTLDEMIASLPASRRRAVARRAADLIAEELCLRDLRRSLGVTQTELARRLGKGQDAVSRIEMRDDLLLSTLREYVAAMDGELELTCRFKDRGAVRLVTSRVEAPERGRKRPRRRQGTRLATA